MYSISVKLLWDGRCLCAIVCWLLTIVVGCVDKMPKSSSFCFGLFEDCDIDISLLLHGVKATMTENVTYHVFNLGKLELGI